MYNIYILYTYTHYIFYIYINIIYIYTDIYIVYLGLFTTWLIRHSHGPMMGTSTFTSFPQRGSPSSLWSTSMRMIRHNFKPKHAKAFCFPGDVQNRFCRYGQKSRVFPGTWRICRIYVDLPGGLVCFCLNISSQTEKNRSGVWTDNKRAPESLLFASFGAAPAEP